MPGPFKIEIVFDEKEKALYENLARHCAERGLSPEDLVKDLVKRELGWGQFMRRRMRDKDNRKPGPQPGLPDK